MISPVKLPFGWWLCRDTTRPFDYPPRCRAELVSKRLAKLDEHERAMKALFEEYMKRAD